MKKYIGYIIAILLLIFLVKECSGDPNLKSKIEQLQKQKDSIQLAIDSKNLKIDSLTKTINLGKQKTDSLLSEKQIIYLDRIVRVNEVDSMSVDSLDRIIASTPKRQAVKSIIGYPIALKELEIADNVIQSQKETIEGLEAKDSLKSLVIIDKDNQIRLTESQRDLYKKDSQKNALFLYGEASLFPTPDRFEVGVDYVIRNKLIIGLSGSFNNKASDVYGNVKVGIKIF